MDECTPKCRSRRHASEVFSAITLSREHEDAVVNYLSTACCNVSENTDSDGRSALHLAASVGRMKILDWLVANDAQINVRDRESGYSPLHRAAYFGQLNAVRYLVSRMANLFQLDNDNLTCLDHFICDRLPGLASPNPKLICEAYVWGVNSNYTLGK